MEIPISRGPLPCFMETPGLSWSRSSTENAGASRIRSWVTVVTVCAVGCVTTSGSGRGCCGGAIGAGAAARRVRSAVRRGGAATGGGGGAAVGRSPTTGAAGLDGVGLTTTCGTGTEPGAAGGGAGEGEPGAAVPGAVEGGGCSESAFGL